MVKVAFQGERGAFSEDAVVNFFQDADVYPHHNFRDVFEAVLNDAVAFGVVPVENSQAGSINETYDLLLGYPLKIFGEINLRVSHYLMAVPGTLLSEIKTIYSHPQALAQCDEFLRNLKADVVPTYNTAGSAKKVKEEGLKGYAAVASKRAAQIYDLAVLAEGIETNPYNYTKFFVISKREAEPARKNKTSLAFATENAPGALYECLGVFAKRGINLTKIESRPSKQKPWEYVFYVDFEGHVTDTSCQEAITELEKKTNFLRIFGSYPCAES